MQTRILAADPSGIAEACDWLAQGQPVAMPTETVYGLAADARDGAAVARIYAAKGRPSFNPLIVHLPDLAAVERIATVNAQARQLAEAFWPGPLTMILPLRADSGIASITTAGLETVGIRMPSHPVAQALMRAFDGPLAAPSANPSGRVSPTSAAHVADPQTGLGGRIPAVLDAGPCDVGVESTIVGWSAAGAPALLRPGGVPAEALEAVLGMALLHPELNPEAPTSPGQLASHYAPAVPIRLDVRIPEEGETYVGFGPRHGSGFASDPSKDALSLSPSGDLTEAAARLFDILRRADELGRPIAVAPIPEEGLGAAINDRLRRAAAPR